MNRALGLATVAGSFHASAICGYGRNGQGLRSRPSRHSITTTWASALRPPTAAPPRVDGPGRSRPRRLGQAAPGSPGIAANLRVFFPAGRYPAFGSATICWSSLKADARGNAAIRKRLRPAANRRHSSPTSNSPQSGRSRGDAAYSITRSARSSNDCGILMPSVSADLRLTTNWKVVGSSTGRSAGLAPLSILST